MYHLKPALTIFVIVSLACLAVEEAIPGGIGYTKFLSQWLAFAFCWRKCHIRPIFKFMLSTVHPDNNYHIFSVPAFIAYYFFVAEAHGCDPPGKPCAGEEGDCCSRCCRGGECKWAGICTGYIA